MTRLDVIMCKPTEKHKTNNMKISTILKLQILSCQSHHNTLTC